MWTLSPYAGAMFVVASACCCIACLIEARTRHAENKRHERSNDWVTLRVGPPLTLAGLSAVAMVLTLAKIGLKGLGTLV